MSQNWAVRDSGTSEAVPHKKRIERDLLRTPDFSQCCGHIAGAQHEASLTRARV